MNIPLGLEFLCFYCNDKESIKNKEEFEIEIPEDKIELRPIMFFQISNVKPFDEKTCILSSDCEDYQIAEIYESVVAKIQERVVFKMN